MRLFIAEKPSLARAILAVLPKPHKKSEGYFESGNGDRVTWCLGHLLEQAEPEAYDPKYKRWHLDDLPIVPEQWQLTPRKDTKKQLSVIKKLSKEATQIVHAGDPDREGQLLVDEVINHVKLTKAKAASVQRCLISDLTPNAVKKAVNSLQDNRAFIPLSVSALARARADWLYGLNLTRAYTLRGQQAGFKGVLSVGRVQTPLLGLVVERDRSIADFKPKDYFPVEATFLTQAPDEPGSFKARWVPSEACAKWLDEEGRVLSRPLAENVVQRVSGKPAKVTHLDSKDKHQKAPLPFSLSALQMEANKRFSLSAQQVLDTCQGLYERHQVITYPRSDCRYLPKEHLSQVPEVLAAIGRVSALSEAAQGADAAKVSRAWNDKQVGAHHAIIPTGKTPPAGLSATEQKVYELIARFYLAQFYPDLITFHTHVTCEVEGGVFKASAKQVKQLGWKQVTDSRGANAQLGGSQRGQDGEDTEEAELTQLPPLRVGQALLCDSAEVLIKQTQPPKHFTEATLLAAMTGIARFIEDAELKSVLRETDGLGTEATRAGMIELLLRRGFIRRQGKVINATELGTTFIGVLPTPVVKPDMTARWERELSLMAAKSANYEVFMADMQRALDQLLEDKRAPLPTHVSQQLAVLGAQTPSKGKGRKGTRKTTTRGKAGARATKTSTTAKRASSSSARSTRSGSRRSSAAK